MMHSKLCFMVIHAYRYHGTAAPTKNHSVKTLEAEDVKSLVQSFGIIGIKALDTARWYADSSCRLDGSFPDKGVCTAALASRKEKRREVL